MFIFFMEPFNCVREELFNGECNCQVYDFKVIFTYNYTFFLEKKPSVQIYIVRVGSTMADGCCSSLLCSDWELYSLLKMTRTQCAKVHHKIAL